MEEPETAQHPSSQRKVIEALVSIAETEGCQVIVTTHVPGLAGLAPVEGIRHVRRTGTHTREVLSATSPEILEEIALLGGSTLKQWVNEHLLRNIRLPEIHIYDRDVADANGVFQYQADADCVNARNDGSIAFLTQKREIENYLHPDAIQEAFHGHTATAVTIAVSDTCDVPRGG